MRRQLAVVIGLLCFVFALSACGTAHQATSASSSQSSKSDALTVVTTYAGADVNAGNYQQATADWQKETGYKLDDQSTNSSESFKSLIKDEFANGEEPDVVFFFTGADADSFIDDGKVMSIDAIRADYPDFASNMDDSLIPAHLSDGKRYAVPVNGYWEALYYNKDILDAAGVEAPGEDYTMDQFMVDCAKVKAAGYTPISAALGSTPHYWWEYMIFNQQSSATHDQIPASVTDERAREWIAGIQTIKQIYEAGYFPNETLSIDNNTTSVELFTSGKTAFMIDGSWRVGSIVTSCQSDKNDPTTLDQKKLARFSVSYVPGNGKRLATDIVGGMSQGYYISAKAYNDPAKREMAVNFVKYMTQDSVVKKFATHTTTALKDQTRDNVDDLNLLQKDGLAMAQAATSITPALQDLYQGECRQSTFEGMPELVTGARDISSAVAEGLEIYHKMH